MDSTLFLSPMGNCWYARVIAMKALMESASMIIRAIVMYRVLSIS